MNMKSIALTIMQCAGGYGNGRTYRVAYATKTNGKTCIWMGGDYGASKSTGHVFYITGTINIFMTQSDYNPRRILKVFDIKNNVPVSVPPSHVFSIKGVLMAECDFCFKDASERLIPWTFIVSVLPAIMTMMRIS